MELIGYALDFSSFLVQNTKNLDSIKAIILFGSAARGEAGKKSDVDIFIDIVKDEKLEKEIQLLKGKFFDSSKFKNYWRLLGIENEINVIAGNLNEWKLKDSMLGSSIILYQKYAPKLENGKARAILHWGNIKPNSRRVMLNKKLFGYKHYKRYYPGLMEKHEGVKIGANVILINIEDLAPFAKIFRAFKIPVKIIRIFEYQ